MKNSLCHLNSSPVIPHLHHFPIQSTMLQSLIKQNHPFLFGISFSLFFPSFPSLSLSYHTLPLPTGIGQILCSFWSFLFDKCRADAKGFKIAHFNIRSLWPKIDSLNTISNDLLDLPSYEVIRLDRPPNSRGGGLVTLLNKNKDIVWDPVKHANCMIMNKNAEIQVLQIKPRNIRKMIIVNCYRPPNGNIDSFLDHLQSILDQIDKLEEFELYICSDMNIDYGQPKSPGYKKLKNFEAKYNVSQIITSPTRCTATTSSILDLRFWGLPYKMEES